jgi:hypothetical protein
MKKLKQLFCRHKYDVKRSYVQRSVGAPVECISEIETCVKCGKVKINTKPEAFSYLPK